MRAINMERDMAPGAYADIVAVPDNPRQEISVLGKVNPVMKDGKVYSKP